jgi:hypothetical protein
VSFGFSRLNLRQPVDSMFESMQEQSIALLKKEAPCCYKFGISEGGAASFHE